MYHVCTMFSATILSKIASHQHHLKCWIQFKKLEKSRD